MLCATGAVQMLSEANCAALGGTVPEQKCRWTKCQADRKRRGTGRV